ncbi:Sec-independent protein translocase protein TatB [Salinisphaera sp.]|uniref:Sec-independent protein translocase protein TatB n=1 Tax=Salinisphaera sp. TaxID=1914330 RepID=UPI002D7854C7|nr:Sec-independent protein translocase protein TatB [Salinisphaera sp.]HET7314803.1 Sec-independent protein translocase protein TatB [Salinisphaera sp.]
MFDIGFWELAVLGVIGLIVLGPERLPVVARTLGRWTARARHYVSELTSELEKEVAAEDLRNDVRRAREQIESETREFRTSTEQAVSPLMEPIEGKTERRTDASTEDDNAAQPAVDESEPADADAPIDSKSGAASSKHDENRP